MSRFYRGFFVRNSKLKAEYFWQLNMNRRQKAILIKFVVVIIFTMLAVLAMVNFKDWVNRSEAMLGMKQLSDITLGYKKSYGAVPSQSYIDNIDKSQWPGYVRLGDLQYRARWLDVDSNEDEILAYTKKTYASSLLESGYVVLRLDGRVEWMKSNEFEALLKQQQGEFEIQLMRNE